LNICAGIILCNPDIDRLTKNIDAIINQVSKLVLVDNASDNIAVLKETFADERIEWIINAENRGVSGALNQMFENAYKNGFQWLLTLDDDSACDDSMVDELLTATYYYNNAAIISPRVIDRDITEANKTKANKTKAKKTKAKKTGKESLPNSEEINMCITAGSLTNVKAVISTGGFDERLFIDHVDHDMCLRLRRLGYRIVRVNSAKLWQEFGQETVRRRFLWKVYTQRRYAPFRVYYQTRNCIYMLRKYGREFKRRPNYYYFHLIFAFFARFLYEPKRLGRSKAFISGYFAGLFMKLHED